MKADTLKVFKALKARRELEEIEIRKDNIIQTKPVETTEKK